MRHTPTPGILRRAFIVHNATHVAAVLIAATSLDLPVTLRSAPGAAAWLGSAGFQAMVLDTAAAFPKANYDYVLDCGGSPGLAMNALRHGVAAISLSAKPSVKEKIADMAARARIRLNNDEGPAVDLLDVLDLAAACTAWLNEPRQPKTDKSFSHENE
ncbi:MAG: hypothetical protein ACKVK8_03740 [Rhodospirillales bacterium]